MKLNVKAFALTCGLVWGMALFFLTWWIIMFDGATGEITLIGRIYRGYNISPVGSVIGLIWASLDGLIGGAIFAWMYNFISARCNKTKIVKDEKLE
ncbi:MAG: bacteriophage holin [Desulfotalea sp.]